MPAHIKNTLLASPAASVAWMTGMLILFGSMTTFVALLLTRQVEVTRSLMAVPASIIAAISFAELLLHAAKPKETRKAFPLKTLGIAALASSCAVLALAPEGAGYLPISGGFLAGMALIAAGMFMERPKVKDKEKI